MASVPTRIAIALYLIAIHLLLGLFLFAWVQKRVFVPQTVSDPTERADVPTPHPDLTPCPQPTQQPEATPSVSPISTPVVGTPSEGRSLIIPVSGVTAEQLTDTFTSSRSGGRSHDAIDIMAAAGTPVVAAVDGEIARFFDSVPGGITIYQLSENKQFVYYYAHLQRRSDSIKPGDRVTKGTVIGYVGDTGNAGPGNNHLHFSIARVTDPKRVWEGTYLNPYPFLKSGKAPE
jgi:murein DD-endopeptidase MepM/ murein hydrolase activator NlpD